MDLSDYKNNIKIFYDKYNNLNTIKTKITVLLTELKNKGEENFSEKELKARNKYRSEVYIINSKLLDIPKKPFDTNFQLEKLRKTWNESNVNGYYKLITGLYIWIPSIRSDYTNSVIEDSKIKIKLIKVNKGNEKYIHIPYELKPYIKYWDQLPTTNNSFVQALIRISKEVFFLKLSINIYRKIWTEFGERTMKPSAIIKLSEDMNHSYQIHTTIYMPKMNIVYLD